MQLENEKPSKSQRWFQDDNQGISIAIQISQKRDMNILLCADNVRLWRPQGYKLQILIYLLNGISKEYNL